MCVDFVVLGELLEVGIGLIIKGERDKKRVQDLLRNLKVLLEGTDDVCGTTREGDPRRVGLRDGLSECECPEIRTDNVLEGVSS